MSGQTVTSTSSISSTTNNIVSVNPPSLSETDVIPKLVSIASSNGTRTEWETILEELVQKPTLIQSLSSSIIGAPLLIAIKHHRRDLIESLLKHHHQHARLYSKSDAIQVGVSSLTGIPRTVENHLECGVSHCLSEGLYDLLQYFYENGLTHQDYCPESALNPLDDEIRLQNLTTFYRLWHPSHAYCGGEAYSQLLDYAHQINSLKGITFLNEEDERQKQAELQH